jgi:bacteriocin biosynthesis cyclodehydratase domain-containing protein
MSKIKQLLPRLAFPATILHGTDTVWLVAGEDFRYKLTAPSVEKWLPGLLQQCQGKSSIDDLLKTIGRELQPTAKQLLEQLFGERVLVDGIAQDVHAPDVYRFALEGSGPLLNAISALQSTSSDKTLRVLCQDRLDYETALQFNHRCLQETSPYLWATTGPMSRGYVSPIFLPQAGPCLACLLRHFQRLSPIPEIYDALRIHVQEGKQVEPVQFPEEGIQLLASIVAWKRKQLAEQIPLSSLYRLHVLELDTMEVSSHRVFVDPECPECGHGVA